MALIILFLLLILSFAFHIVFLVWYIQRRKKKYLNYYINTAISNVVFALCLIIVALYRPEQIRQIDMKFFMWSASGMIMIFTLAIKISILRRIYTRAQDPDYYHYNYFGKKVLHNTVVKPTEIMAFFITMPFFLFLGAYFIARMINYFLYGHL